MLRRSRKRSREKPVVGTGRANHRLLFFSLVRTSRPVLFVIALVLGAVGLIRAQTPPPHYLWIEAETMGPLRGSNFSFQDVDQQERGSWAISGPGVAAEWTQGGESEFMSIAARANEPAGVTAWRDLEIPAAGRYALWVRYADYANKAEEFGVRVRQGSESSEHRFGLLPVVDELDPMKLFWGWSFGWDHAELSLKKGPARVELYTTGPTGARRQVDCLCLTTDPAYHPTGRRKPPFAAWEPLRVMRAAGLPEVEPLATRKLKGETPKAWQIASGPPTFLWNVGDPWRNGLKQPAAERIDVPYGVDSSLQKLFVETYRGMAPPLFGNELSGPSLHIPAYPTAFAAGSPELEWLSRHPRSRFAILHNYAEPAWNPAAAAPADRAAIHANLTKLDDRFVGYIEGESILHGISIDRTALEQRVRAAKSRQEILDAFRELYTAGAVKKFGSYYGTQVTPEQAWGPVVSCLSAGMEGYSHALLDWGARRIGHESSANSPELARRLAFLRGAARQFGRKIVDYQSGNLGDASMTLAPKEFFYPASPRYILDNQYDAWSGAGINWVLKDYLLFHLAGADAFYHEEGHDLYWKPGGGAAGDAFPLQLSPRGRVVEAVQHLVEEHPRGTQVTPVAFLLDEAHGWSQEHFDHPTAWGLAPEWNPRLLTPGPHEASIRGWFDIAYFPAPETQSEPASAIRQTYVNGMFGDLFDVIVTAPKRTAIASTYPVLIAAGEVPVSAEWGTALRQYVRGGGTLVVAEGQLSGPGAASLELADAAPAGEASAFTWGGTTTSSNVFRYHRLPVGKDRVLVTAPDGAPICTAHAEGKGQVIRIGIPYGLGIDQQPVPLLGLLMRRLTEGLVPVQVTGDVEWTLNRLEDGGWLVSLFNNRGVIKPQHGVTPVDHAEAQEARIHTAFTVGKNGEWVAGASMTWQAHGSGSEAKITVPAGSVRWVVVYPRR